MPAVSTHGIRRPFLQPRQFELRQQYILLKTVADGILGPGNFNKVTQEPFISSNNGKGFSSNQQVPPGCAYPGNLCSTILRLLKRRGMYGKFRYFLLEPALTRIGNTLAQLNLEL